MPVFDSLENGAALDGDIITACFAALSEMARGLAGDVFGRAVWIGGAEITSNVSGGDLYAEMSPGDFYVEEVSTSVPSMTLATRSRQPTRSVLIPQAREVVVSVIPYNTDAQFGALLVTPITERPPFGSVALAWLGTGYTDIRSTIDARSNTVWGAVVEASGDSFRARNAWVPVADARLAVLVYPGEQIEVCCAADVTDGLVDEYKDQNRLPKGKEHVTEFTLSYNGVVIEDYNSGLSLGWLTTVPTARTYYAEWLFDPFANGDAQRIFRTADPNTGGVVVCELLGRGLAVSIDTLWLQIRVRPKELVP